MQSQITSIGAFVGGLNTEQPQLADQIQYTTDELNCQLLPDGTRARRYGVTREENSKGFPMTFKEETGAWATASAATFNTLTTAKVFRFKLVVDYYNSGIVQADVPPQEYEFILNGEEGVKRFTFSNDNRDTPYMRFYTSDGQYYDTSNFWNTLFYSASGTYYQDITGREITWQFASDGTNYTREIFDENGDSYQGGEPMPAGSVSDKTFNSFLNIVNEEFSFKNNNEVEWIRFHIEDIAFVEDGEEILTPTSEDESEGLSIVYNTPGVYKVNITKEGMYTVWMSGGGAKEAVQKSTRKFSYGYIYNTIHGSAGGGIKFYGFLKPGEYTIVVGATGNGRGTASLSGGFYLWNPATETSIVGPDINIVAGGGSSRVFWAKEAREYVIYEGHTSTRGDVSVNAAPINFSVAARTNDNEFSPISFINNEASGPGGINQNGFFRIAKGIYTGGALDDDPTGTITVSRENTNAYYWANYDKAGSNCIVVQVGSGLKFFEASRPYDHELITEILSTEMFIKNEGFKKYEFSSGEGYLLCVSEYSQPFYVTLDKETKTAIPTGITLQIRDLFGVEDYMAIDEVSGTLSNRHRYNLLNQGWDDGKINSFRSSQTVYPSNVMIWWYGKNANNDFDAGLLTKQYFGTTPAPKGHFILDYFDQDRSAKSGVPGIDKVVKDRYCCSSEFFAGRFFYLTSSTVLFSQIVREDIRGIGKCYQDADPTSQTISDIIATDGGEIIFQDLGYGKRIKKFPLGILVFGTKSVYAVTSTSSNTFSATQYLTQFVTNAGCVSGGSVISAEDIIYYWSPQGIYQITVDTVSGTQAIASSMSSSTIQQWYNSLPNFSKENCVGAYDYSNRRLVWMYPTNEDDLENRDGLLVYYLDFKAFLPSKISSGGELITVFETALPTFIVPSIALFAGDFEVAAGDDDVIVKDFGQEYGRQFSVCYLGYIKSYDKLFFCDFYSRDFLDWQESLYKSYAVSYPITFGSTWRKQYTPTLQCYFLRTEEDELTDGKYLAPSSCYLSARWKWSETQASDRWDLSQNAYIRIPRFMEFRYVNGKIRVRGSGPAVQYKIESKDDDDFKLSSLNMLIRTV